MSGIGNLIGYGTGQGQAMTLPGSRRSGSQGQVAILQGQVQGKPASTARGLRALPEKPEERNALPGHLAPTDTYRTNDLGAGTVNRTQMQGHIQKLKQKDQVIDGMLVQDRNMGEEQRQYLRNGLASIDTDTLRFAQENGVRIQMVRPGDSLIDAGIVKPQNMEEFNQNFPEHGRTANNVLDQVNSQYSERLSEAAKADVEHVNRMTQQSAARGGQPFIPDPTTSNVNSVHLQRRGEINRQLMEQTDGNVMLYEPLSFFAGSALPQGPEGNRMVGEHVMQPVSTQTMAMVHGCRTPEEFREFNQRVEQLNGGKLKNLRSESLQHFSEQMKSQGMPAEEIAKRVQHFNQHPELIPIDHFRNDILVPALFHYRANDNPMNPAEAAKSKPTTVNVQDYMTLRTWQGPDGRIYSQQDGIKLGKQGTVNGQYFQDQRLIVLRAEEYGLNNHDTPAHEFGHAIDYLLKEKNPEFYQQWRQNVENAYTGTRNKPGSWISPYSRTNTNEYVAEGFSFFHLRSKILKTLDPTLFQLMQQMTQASAGCGRAG